MTNLQERLVELTRDLILIPSTAENPKERERCFEFIKNHIEPLESIELYEYRKCGVPSLVVLPKDIKVPEILICAHLDVVGHPQESYYRSRIENGRIYGPGAGDMKGALAIVLEIFHHFQNLGERVSLGLVVTSDEEIGGRYGIQYLTDERELRCGVAMIPDGGSLDEITIEEKGILHLKVCCQGHAAHAARPWLGQNAVQILIDRLSALNAYFDSLVRSDDHWRPTCSVTIMDTPNRTINRIPTEAECQLDIRFPSPNSVDSILAKTKEILGPQVDCQIIISAEPTHQSPDSLYLSVTEEMTGNVPTLTRADAGSDARFFSRIGIPTIISSPIVGNLHSEEEWIDIKSMETFYQIYRAYIKRKLRL